jgi:hypothetical protein
VPIVNIRYWDENGYHTSIEDQVVRARLNRDTGSSDNHVQVTSVIGKQANIRPFDMLDRWLAAIEADHSAASAAQKVRTDKPADLVDTCVIQASNVTNTQRCQSEYPHYSKPRLVAGGPLTEDALKCQLRPANRADYPVQMTTSQFARLLNIFPSGVCDWSMPGVDASAPRGPWQSFADGPDGRPLGPPPTSTKIRH